MRPLGTRKLVTALVCAASAALLTLGSLAAGASAAPNPGPPDTTNADGPQAANIPYVAWIGEHVRLVVCDPSITPNAHIVSAVAPSGPSQWANYQVEDWSGYPYQAPTPDGDAGSTLGQEFNPGPAAFFESSEPAHESDRKHDGCVATDYKSLDPGLARIRVVVRDTATHEVVFSHQFIVIWLVADPVLHEAALTSSGSEVFQSQLNGEGKVNLARFLGDPSGDGQFAPSPFVGGSNEDKGLIQIKVTGSFPVIKESPLANVLKMPTYVLPNDWVLLAEALASSSEETEPPGSNPALWDIHGTPSLDPGFNSPNEYQEVRVEELGNPAKVCTTGKGGAPVSPTDNCNGKGTTGELAGETPLNSKFSRIFGDLTSGATSTVGPFDPQAANETLLSDGRLTEDDAPMPALRLDVSIAANKGGMDLGGVGQIEEADKAMIYSHDFTGTTKPHNLYNPYYAAYIPATDRPVSEASGVDGPSPGGDFPGFLNEHPTPYEFWTLLKPRNERISTDTGCLRRLIDEQANDYATPEGPLTHTLYTDERGEAYVTYTPGDQFYLNHLVSNKEEKGKIIKNGDGGCDLKGVYQEVIGESSITATGVYPYEPVDYPPASSEPVVKTVRSLWEKEFFEFPKGPGANEQSVRIVVAKAQDIDGNPIVDETVCFFAQGGGLSQFTGTLVEDPKEELYRDGGIAYVGGSFVAHPVGQESKFCETTNAHGLAAIEVTNSTLSAVDLNVNYLEESIIRDHNVLFVEPTVPTGLGRVAATAPPTPATVAALITPVAPALSLSKTVLTKPKPLTASQRLARALKSCKLHYSAKRRTACIARARKSYQASRKKELAILAKIKKNNKKKATRH